MSSQKKLVRNSNKMCAQELLLPSILEVHNDVDQLDPGSGDWIAFPMKTIHLHTKCSVPDKNNAGGLFQLPLR